MTVNRFKKLLRAFSVAVAIVFIWRGTWYLLDILDDRFFGGSHVFSAVGGIIVGVLLLYFPDRDLKELAKL